MKVKAIAKHMIAALTMALILTAVGQATAFEPAQPGKQTSKLFDPAKDVKAPEGMTWMSCSQALGYVNGPYGRVVVYGGPYLIERPKDYTLAIQREYAQTFGSEYLQQRPTEFPGYKSRDRFKNINSCIIASHSHDTARYWFAPQKDPRENFKTDFIPSFAK